MIPITLIEPAIALAVFVSMAGLLGAGTAWAVAAPVWITTLLTAVVPPAGVALFFAVGLQQTLRRRKAMRRLAYLARQVAIPPIPSFLWNPRIDLQAAPR
jgi:hypothetical protein